MFDPALDTPADLGFLIADSGHPQWPGWWAIILICLALQGMVMWQSMNGGDPFARPRPTPARIRVVRTRTEGTPARAVAA